MSEFWSWWVVVLIIFNLGVTFVLFLWGPRARVPVLPDGTTGHVWANGTLREGMHRLPLWWILISFAMYISAVAYFVLYPGFGNYKGLLDWTSQGQYARDRSANAALLDATMKRLAPLPIEQLGADPQAMAIAQVLYRDNCAACHGRAGHGSQALGAPNLSDHDWLWGGSGELIEASILDGRNGVMPPWGEALGEDGVVAVANFVLGLSGAPHDAAKAAAGKEAFETNCAACHGADGKGNQDLGAPNLTDSIWLYGGDLETVETTIRDGRSGLMPPWRERLGERDVRLLAGYVHSLSQGGAAPAR